MISVFNGTTLEKWDRVDYMDHMGTDDRVVDAARVSMAKAASNYTSEKNASLIAYLAREEHWTPFAHPHITFRFRAPFAISEQLKKHQVGMVWNEVSRRYVDDPPWVFVPDGWRTRPANVKQGSDPDKLVDLPFEWWSDAVNGPLRDYKRMLHLGIAPEQARFILPTSVMTEWVWTGSLYSWFNVYRLRSDVHAQHECRGHALDIKHHCQQLFPVSWEMLTNALVRSQ